MAPGPGAARLISVPGPADIVRFIAATAGLILGPIVAAVAFGFLQLGVYKLLVRWGVLKPEDIPIFPILAMRGLLLMLVAIAIGVFYFKFGVDEPVGPAPSEVR